MSNGTWVLVYEADNNNSYSLKFLFHLRSGGTFDDPTLLTSDIDGDAKEELVIMSGVYLMVFKSNSNDEYYLWYLKREDTKDGVQVYDFDNNSKQDFIISKFVLDSLNRGRFKADVYLASGLVSVRNDHVLPSNLQLQPNYPNPFNSSTRIRYSLPSIQRVILRVYDVLGRQVAVLESGLKSAGTYTVNFDASQLASGVYIYRLQADEFTTVRKMLLVK